MPHVAHFWGGTRAVMKHFATPRSNRFWSHPYPSMLTPCLPQHGSEMEPGVGAYPWVVQGQGTAAGSAEHRPGPGQSVGWAERRLGMPLNISLTNVK